MLIFLACYCLRFSREIDDPVVRTSRSGGKLGGKKVSVMDYLTKKHLPYNMNKKLILAVMNNGGFQTFNGFLIMKMHTISSQILISTSCVKNIY